MEELKQFLFMVIGIIVLANIVESNIWFVVSIVCLIAYSNVILYQNKNKL